MQSATSPFPPSDSSIPVIGVVGGVGSGKSSIVKALAELAPVAIIDADKLGHQALEVPEVKRKLRQRFGPEIFDADGNVIRAQLAKLVFGDEIETQKARSDLEAISHPEIDRLTAEQITRHRTAKLARWIILDAALLLEAGWNKHCDVVVFVEVAPDRRRQRAKAQRGWSDEEWRRREASQWPVDRKRSAAEIVISNDGTLDEAAKSLRDALDRRFGPQRDGCQ